MPAYSKIFAALAAVSLFACGGKKDDGGAAEVITIDKGDAAAPAPENTAPDAAAPLADSGAAPDAAPSPETTAAPDAAATVADVAAATDSAPAPVLNPTGTIKVTVLSATVKDKLVAGAEATFQKEGMSSVRGTTDDKGIAAVPHAFPADDASLKMIIKKEGFSPLVVSCPCNGMSYAISETLPELESFRVVLNWGGAPADLDLHVAYPENHVYFSAKEGTDADLDVDDTDGFGPETITIRKRHAGEKYVFAVHDYTHSGQHGLRALANSSAKVFVYVGQSLIRSYYVPPTQRGELWVLFSVDGNGAVQDLNNIVDISESEAVGPYLDQLVRRADMGLPQRTSREDVARAADFAKRGDEAFDQGRVEAAVELYQGAAQAHPASLAAFQGLAKAFGKLGRKAEAEWAQRKADEIAALPAAIGFRVPNERVTLTASSVLANWKHYDFKGANLIDDNLWTSWQPDRKAPGGVGEWVKMQFATPQELTGLEFSNGFRRLDELGDLYVMNNRIQDAVITFSDGTEMPIHFDDVMGEKTFTLPAPKKTDWIQLTVKSIYKGTRWNDLAVSEFHALAKDE